MCVLAPILMAAINIIVNIVFMSVCVCVWGGGGCLHLTLGICVRNSMCVLAPILMAAINIIVNSVCVCVCVCVYI